jgi:hypothetical protein
MWEPSTTRNLIYNSEKKISICRLEHALSMVSDKKQYIFIYGGCTRLYLNNAQHFQKQTKQAEYGGKWSKI